METRLRVYHIAIKKYFIDDEIVLLQNVAGKREPFFLFCSVFDASLINKEVAELKKPIYFELSMGKHIYEDHKR